MPYRDKVRQKEYQKVWVRQKRHPELNVEFDKGSTNSRNSLNTGSTIVDNEPKFVPLSEYPGAFMMPDDSKIVAFDAEGNPMYE